VGEGEAEDGGDIFEGFAGDRVESNRCAVAKEKHAKACAIEGDRESQQSGRACRRG